MFKISLTSVILVLIAVIGQLEAFYLGNFYANAPMRYGDVQHFPADMPPYVMPDMHMRRLANTQSESAETAPPPKQQAQTQEKKKSAKDGLVIKRFRPCYYSPIQCLIKRR